MDDDVTVVWTLLERALRAVGLERHVSLRYDEEMDAVIVYDAAHPEGLTGVGLRCLGQEADILVAYTMEPRAEHPYTHEDGALVCADGPYDRDSPYVIKYAVLRLAERRLDALFPAER